MKSLEDYIVSCAMRLDQLLADLSNYDENIATLYELQLRSILRDIKNGRKKAPSDILNGYWYYFSPEGPWGIWDKFPLLVRAMSELINLLNLEDDEAFDAYCKRHGLGLH